MEYAPILATVLTRSARKRPSASSASAASVTLSRPWASAMKDSERVSIHFTGRPTRFEASSVSGPSLNRADFMPKLPPTSPAMTRTRASGTLSTRVARSER